MAYWVFPNPNMDSEVTKNITCVRLLQMHLNEYRSARDKFENDFPDRPIPPVLVAYRWDERRQLEAIVAPRTSYNPSAVKTPANQKFQ